MKILKMAFPLLLITVTVTLIAHSFNMGEFWWVDESRHAMDGLFIMDMLRDHPSLTSLYR